MKTYFKGGKGIANPIDVNGQEIKVGDTLTRDCYDNKDYGLPVTEAKLNDPFYVVEQGDGFLFAQSIDSYSFTLGENKFYLHDFRFKFTKN